MDPILDLREVSKVYGSGETAVQALTGATLQVRAGEVVLVEGPSGSGKTTLLSIMGCLMKPTAGQVMVKGRDIVQLKERDMPQVRAGTFGFIFQGFNLFPALTALENVAVTIRMKDPRARKVHVEAARLLGLVGLGDRMHHLPADLSGGQKQRVAIARALACSPPVILGDEPTAALDSKTGLAVMKLLQSLAREEGRAVVVVTHDHRLEQFSDRVIRVEDGTVLSDRPSLAPEPHGRSGPTNPAVAIRTGLEVGRNERQ
ncbi:MAG: ABC transporter ATP-binding protein [Deltaproteobacteria bacterium]|nr:ABC transporter ATP-binding protein [Deltaproteobacteria bacterium]